MLYQPLIVYASARKESDTKKFVELLFSEIEYECIDLLDHSIEHYNYNNDYSPEDHFLEIINTILHHNAIVFATPVYWYSMSGLLKLFFDRFTDLVTVHKSLGRKLKDKNVFLLAVGAEKELPPGFEVPFQSTCNYLDMFYGGSIYYSTKFIKDEKKLKAEMDEFRGNIKNC